MATFSYTPADTGTTVTETLYSVKLSGGTSYVADRILDTGTTVSETIGKQLSRFRSATDTGMTLTDAFVRRTLHVIADTGLTLSDSIAKRHRRFITQTGATISDSLVQAKIATMNVWEINSFRGWTFNTTVRGWWSGAVDVWYGRSGDAVTPQSRKE